MIVLALLLAVAAALGLAIGTHLQHRAVGAAPGAGSAGSRVARALTTPLWALGTGIIVLENGLNVVALGLAPVAVVQPIGSLALVCAVIISARALGVRVNGGLVAGIVVAVASVSAFVGVSAVLADPARPTEGSAALLAWLLLCLILVAVLIAYRGAGHLIRVVGAAVMFGAVAASTHVVAVEGIALLRGGSAAPAAVTAAPSDILHDGGPVSVRMLWILVVLVLVATVVGAWLVQTAYASGPPETVLAGLTVLDPLVAVLIGASVLREWPTVPPIGLAAILLSGLAACAGIALIVRNHPALDRRRGRGAGTARGAPPGPPSPRSLTTFDPRSADADGVALPDRRS